MPETQQYRVTSLGAMYQKPTETLAPDGTETTLMVPTLAMRGETIELTKFEAKRLEALGVVKDAEEPKAYDEMSEDEVKDLVQERNIDVRGSGPEGEIRHEDRVNALNIYDHGLGLGAYAPVGVSTVPGNVATVESGSSGLTNQYKGSAGEVPAGAPDASTESVEVIAQWIQTAKPSTDHVVALAGDNPETAQKVLEAERVASGGDPRSTVEKRLSKIANRGE